MSPTSDTLPDFLVIAAPRSGTTWLHQALAAHPGVFVPTRRKEVHFLDRHFDRGIEWYAKFFTAADPGQRIGEITPHYLYCETLTQRLTLLPSVRQLVAVLRDPVERAFSHFRWRIRHDAYPGSFEQFLRDYPEAISWGEYAAHLCALDKWIHPERLLVLRYEHLFSPSSAIVEAELDRVATFLGINAAPFYEKPIAQRVNAGTIPRYPKLSRAASRAAQWLRRRDLDWAVNAARSAGLKRVANRGVRTLEGPKPDTVVRLNRLFDADVARLRALTGLEFDGWLADQRPHAFWRSGK